MGMDVSGKEPTSETGKYFRNNAWWWRPLWDYAAKKAPNIIGEKLHTSGHYNDGAGLDAKCATALAKVLQAEIESGRCAIYANDYMAKINGTPDEECDLCHGTGTRTDARLVSFVMSDQPGPCNGCEGKGHKRPNSTYYPFSVENVVGFVAFLRDCGGFEIN